MKGLYKRYEILKQTYRKCAGIHEDEPTTCHESIERAGRLYRPRFIEVKASKLLDDAMVAIKLLEVQVATLKTINPKEKENESK